MKSKYLIIGAGIHGLSSAWHLAEKLKNKKIDIPIVDLSGIDDCKKKLDDLSNKIIY